MEIWASTSYKVGSYKNKSVFQINNFKYDYKKFINIIRIINKFKKIINIIRKILYVKKLMYMAPKTGVRGSKVDGLD